MEMGMGMEVEGLRASLEEMGRTEREMSTPQRRKGWSRGRVYPTLVLAAGVLLASSVLSLDGDAGVRVRPPLPATLRVRKRAGHEGRECAGIGGVSRASPSSACAEDTERPVRCST
ncbi:hypothetical protein B0H13DRAFT_2672485 [Mycena leptocephala]|nr:hypothetical protein B0H13DRAFT_2672485 [Mycena leptocephala]